MHFAWGPIPTPNLPHQGGGDFIYVAGTGRNRPKSRIVAVHGALRIPYI